jgi:hypothetical protein
MFKDLPLIFTRKETLTGSLELNKALLQFQSFVINRWSLIEHDFYRLGVRGGDKEKAVSIAVMMLLAAFAEAGLRRVSKWTVDLLVDGKIDMKYDESIPEEAMRNLVTNIPVLGQIDSVTKYNSIPVPTLSAIVKIRDSYKYLKSSKRKRTREKNTILFFNSLMRIAGIPGVVQLDEVVKDAYK